MTKTFDLILLNCDAWYEPGRFERSAHDIPSSTYVRRHAGAASLPGHPASGSPRMIAAVDTVALVVVGMATPSRSGRSTSVRRRVLPSSPGAGCGASRFQRRPGGSASPAHRRVDRQSTPFGSMAQGIRGAVPTGRNPRQRPQNPSRKTPSWARVLSELWGRHGDTTRQPSNPPGPEHPSPCSPSSSSRTSHGTIKSAQPGSAHHHPAAALAPSPNSRVIDKYEHCCPK